MIEAKEVEGKVFGFTDNYVKVCLDYDESLINQIVEVDLEKVDYWEEELVMMGSLVKVLA
ncbi:MAG: hypothetical protein GY810_11870 [Aureispira sp.]|nr:hypothetical protein [Aureispira sp.]